MNELLLTLSFSLFFFMLLLAQNQDTIVVFFNKMRYENAVKEKLEKGSGNFAPGLYDKYAGCRLRMFSIPVFEWNQKAQKYTCDSHEKLENMLLFEENPYFQIVLFTYYLKHPTDFIFRIADFEGFWVVRSHKLHKLEGGRLVDANQYSYMSGEEYIQDAASGSFRIGKKYTGCFDKETAKRMSVKGKDVYINIIK